MHRHPASDLKFLILNFKLRFQIPIKFTVEPFLFILIIANFAQPKTPEMDQISTHFFLENFSKDRNVILKRSQENSIDTLLKFLVNLAIKKYKILFNPLGLIDDTFDKIIRYQYDGLDQLVDIYENLSVAYRYQNSDNQLEIIWDGRTHDTVYTEKWMEKFKVWTDNLTQNPAFTKGIILLTVFQEVSSTDPLAGKNDFFIKNSLKAIINQYFEIKILKRNGFKRVYHKQQSMMRAS